MTLMSKSKTTLFLYLFSLFGLWAQSQNRYSFSQTINTPVFHGNDTLLNPWAGGLNHPVFNMMDLNFDGTEDLVVYDRSGFRVLTFLKEEINGDSVFRYHPEYAKAFPLPETEGSFILLRDYNCDGLKDIFFGDGRFIRVFTNTSQGNTLSFTPALNGGPLQTDYSLSGVSSLYVSLADLPLIADLDGDGDIDIATFGNGGFRVEFHENISSNNCGLQFDQTGSCWGGFREGGFWRSVDLGACFNGGGNKRNGPDTLGKTLHEGSAMLTWDLNNDGLDDLLLSNVEFNNLSALYNTGQSDSAYFSSQDTLYPNSNPVDHYIFPAPYRAEVSFDAVDDLLISSYSSTMSGSGDASSDHRGVLRYVNQGTNSLPNFVLQEDNFLQGDMIDFGSNATPRLVDINNDGLTDLIVAIGRRFIRPTVFQSQLYYYENTGTQTQPEFTLRDTNFADLLTYNLGENLVPAFGDLDGDGDLDFILGAETGYFHYFRNDGSATNPSYSLHTPIITNTTVGGNAVPYLYDIDEDGDLDLFVGSLRGHVWFFENQSSSQPDFQLKNDFFGAINVSRFAYSGNATPVFLRDSLGTVAFVGSTDDGVQQFDALDSVAVLPSAISDTFGNLATVSNNFNESPFGSERRTGRNQILMRADELTAKGYMRGYISSLSFHISQKGPNSLSQGLTIRVENVGDSSLNGFYDSFTKDPVISNRTVVFNRGWVTIPFVFPHLWDGKSNLLIEVCFSGNFPDASTVVSMSPTPFASYAHGNMTGYNTFTADGCTMPYEQSLNKRPDLMISLTPAASPLQGLENPNLFTGYNSSPDFADLNNDGFLDAVVGNRAGGLSLFYGRLYDVGLPDWQAKTPRYFELYPNPTRDRVQIEISAAGQGLFDEIQVRNLQGQVLFREKLQSQKLELGTAQWPDGLYLVELKGNNLQQNQRLVIQRR